MADLFANAGQQTLAYRPLADKLRPQELSDIVGQDHLLGPTGALTQAIQAGLNGSLIFWGPPGSGKTTAARLLAKDLPHHFEQVSALSSTLSSLREIFEQARVRHNDGLTTLLFVDEIHRFNKAQLDAFLPVIENGTIILVGATTENPSFELNGALLSRCSVLVFHRLEEKALNKVILAAETYLGEPLHLESQAKATLIRLADGDARFLINMIEKIASLESGDDEITHEDLLEIVQKRAPAYDRQAEQHYNLISALHKSVRGSDPDAALYWFSRMLDGGEDPLYLGRRLVRMASEDIGLADPQALGQATTAVQAFQMLGSPEGELALAQCVVYLATAPKSNAVYSASKTAMNAARKTGSLAPPNHILNGVTKLMKDQGYGEGYIYDHDTPNGFSGQNYFPDSLKRENYYQPVERGFERDIAKRLEFWNKQRQNKSKS